MEEDDYILWHIDYVSCEGNIRWTIARAPLDWSEDDVSHGMTSQGSCGDEPAEIMGVREAYVGEEWVYDFT